MGAARRWTESPQDADYGVAPPRGISVRLGAARRWTEGGCDRGANCGDHFLPFTWLSSSENVGRSPEYKTLRPNSTATCGA